MFLKILRYAQGNAFARVSFYAATLLKKRLWHRGFRVNFCKMFKNTFFAERLWMTACILQQQMALYFAIKYSWQLSSREKSLFGKKILHIFRGFYRFRHFLMKIFSFIFSYTKHMLYFEQTTVSLDWRHLNTILLTNFENLNSISNIFQETLHFLVLTDPRIICIYLRTSDRHFRHQGNVRHSASELLKCVLV